MSKPSPSLIGQRRWCINQSTEAVSYGHGLPCEPWIGLIVGCHEFSYKLCQFDEDTGEPDHDENASCFINSDGMFETEYDAWLAYRKAAHDITSEWSAIHLEADHQVRKLTPPSVILCTS